MKTMPLVILACLASVTAAVTAEAEQCSTQINALRKRLSAPPSAPGEAGMTSPGTMSPGNSANQMQNVPAKSPPPNAAAAQTALDHAKQLDQADREAECQAEVIKAKAAFSAQ